MGKHREPVVALESMHCHFDALWLNSPVHPLAIPPSWKGNSPPLNMRHIFRHARVFRNGSFCTSSTQALLHACCQFQRQEPRRLFRFPIGVKLPPFKLTRHFICSFERASQANLCQWVWQVLFSKGFLRTNILPYLCPAINPEGRGRCEKMTWRRCQEGSLWRHGREDY